MENIKEFIFKLSKNHPDKLKNIIGETNFLFIQNKEFKFDFQNEIFCEIYDEVYNYILDKDNCNHIENEDIYHEGGDEWVYENGVWVTECYEIFGFYYMIEPEGEIYGLYRSLNEIDVK